MELRQTSATEEGAEDSSIADDQILGPDDTSDTQEEKEPPPIEKKGEDSSISDDSNPKLLIQFGHPGGKRTTTY